jgi:hypothetical protein
MSFGINGAVGKFSLLSMLLMPDATSSAQDRAIDGHGTSARDPRLNQFHHMAVQAANLQRQRLWDG